MSYPIIFNSNTIKLPIHTSCYFLELTLCYNVKSIVFVKLQPVHLARAAVGQFNDLSRSSLLEKIYFYTGFQFS